MRRAGTMLVLAVCVLMSWSRPAAAHGGARIVATNFETALNGVSPPLPGVRLRLVEAGSRLELHNEGPEVVVLGAGGEPYLRVGPEGAFENRRSPSAARNRHSVHDQLRTASGAPEAAPEWSRLGRSPLVRWHDHRIDWRTAGHLPEVDSAPARRQLVLPRWEIPLQRGPDRSVAFGTLTWVPGPAPGPWFALMGAGFVAVAALGLLRRWAAPLAVASAVVLAADFVHATSVAFAFAGGLGTHLARLVTGSFFAFAGWALALVAIRLLRRGRIDGLYAAVFAGLSMAVFGGLLELAKLSRSVSLSALPPDLARLCVALSAGGGLGLAAACLVVIQRTPEARRVVGGGHAPHGDGHEPAQPGPTPDGVPGALGATAQPGR